MHGMISTGELVSKAKMTANHQLAFPNRTGPRFSKSGSCRLGQFIPGKHPFCSNPVEFTIASVLTVAPPFRPNFSLLPDSRTPIFPLAVIRQPPVLTNTAASR
jgi:hypothetical protein